MKVGVIVTLVCDVIATLVCEGVGVIVILVCEGRCNSGNGQVWEG